MNTQVRRPSLEDLYREVDHYIPAAESCQPPRIGLSANRKDGLSCIAETYVRSVVEAGGAPVLLPVITDIKALSVLVDDLDGLILSGGGDINPLYLSEEPIPQLQDVDTLRDEYDLILLRLAMHRQIPIMGICRGHQLLNVAFGGGMYQDIHVQNDRPLLKHSQTQTRELPSHTVRIEAIPSRLRALLKEETVYVNSFHHQAIKEPAPEFIATATAPDGINEAMEHPEKDIFSVQWHPEAMAPEGDRTMQLLFQYQTARALQFRKAKEMHERILTIDSHTDTPMLFPGTIDLGIKGIAQVDLAVVEPEQYQTQTLIDIPGKVNLPLMEEGRLDAACMVAYIPQGELTDTAHQAAYDYAAERLSQVIRQEELYPARMGIARSVDDLLRLKQEKKKAIMLGVENGYAIGTDLSRLSRFKEMGIVYMTLCHNGHNAICDSAAGTPQWNGLSPFGREVVKEMNRLGLMIDVSHAAEKTFFDVLEVSQMPIIASHSSARALCDHRRNLTDEQIKLLAEKDGVVQVCLYKGFINKEETKASLSDAIRHINHIVDRVGIDHVGIGSDFDGGGELIGCSAANELINITVRLLDEGYSEDDIRKIWGGNLMRVMRAVQGCC
ncbi:gamma-glutamyl-gamma-aminobutyrate hydrolase family protein [Parabacteroides sp. PF5-6]|uniref:gamma-glutamyl-gamma-aminobutyrate hydrolase family protein n=1 Tax=Parabacteroides sp. PF5-6 TaxID=1742403 RepID=UPI002406D506|nr:gamma-glutamyl-gamma-aminobutyrate hydrolase family protein [Parabacteroides sp. PF5-6]MDF9830784.1 membrane dipeptidase [Parabacteroides sp. PF5-6]